jgi:taurine dioxygenase
MSYKYFTVQKETPTIGATINDIDLTKDNPPEMIEELKDVLAKNRVIFIRDQDMSAEKFHEFGRSFGTLEVHEFFPKVDGYPEIQSIQTKGGRTGTDQWHTDVTFRDAPSSASILRAVDIPPEGGGDTMWLCTHAAFMHLSKPIRELLLKLDAIHDMRYGMTGYVDPDVVEKTARENPPRTHPAVISHPVTGNPHLFVNSIWTPAFDGLSPEESRYLLDFLFDHVKKPEFQVRLKWEVNTIAIWDNIATQHYAIGDYKYQRIMNRMIVDGVTPAAYAA